MQGTAEQVESLTNAKRGEFRSLFASLIGDWKWGLAARYLAALTLLISAGLKGYQVGTQPIPGNSIFAKSSFIVPLVEVEGAIAILLFFNVFPRLMHKVALSLFAILLSFSVYNAITGADNCHCFGTMTTNPRDVAVLDFAILTLLVLTSRSPVFDGHQHFLGIACASLICLISVPFLLGITPLGLAIGQDVGADTDAFDFGKINNMDAGSLHYNFVINNGGSKPVRLVRSESTCRCTVPTLPRDPIQPGQSISLPITANWMGRFGPQREKIYIFTDSPTVSRLTLSLSGNIIAVVVYWPSVVDFGNLLEGETRTRTLTISPGADQAPFHVSSINTIDPYIHVEPSPADPDEPNAISWKLTLLKDAKVGSTQSTLVIQSDSGVQRQFEIPIAYQVSPTIRLVPDSVVFSFNQVASEKLVSIDSAEKIQGISIVPIENSSEGLAINLSSPVQTNQGFHYTAAIRITKSIGAHFVNAKILFAGERSSVELPVIVVP